MVGGMQSRSQGFSFIELLVTMAIVGVLYMTLLGPSSAGVQAKKRALCLQNLAQMHTVLTLYAAEHDGAFPVVPGAVSSEVPLSELVPRYTTDTTIFTCPGSGGTELPGALPFAHRHISYAYVMGLPRDAPADAMIVSDAQVDTRAKTTGEALFSTSGSAPGANHGPTGGHLLFVDGHVEWTGARAPRAMLPPPGTTLLNPKP